MNPITVIKQELVFMEKTPANMLFKKESGSAELHHFAITIEEHPITEELLHYQPSEKSKKGEAISLQ